MCGATFYIKGATFLKFEQLLSNFLKFEQLLKAFLIFLWSRPQISFWRFEDKKGGGGGEREEEMFPRFLRPSLPSPPPLPFFVLGTAKTRSGGKRSDFLRRICLGLVVSWSHKSKWMNVRLTFVFDLLFYLYYFSMMKIGFDHCKIIRSSVSWKKLIQDYRTFLKKQILKTTDCNCNWVLQKLLCCFTSYEKAGA